MTDAPPPLDDDALSGRKFVRWNLGALLVACAALGVGALIHTRSSAGGGPVSGSSSPGAAGSAR